MKYTNKQIADKLECLIKQDDLTLNCTPKKTLNKIRSLIKQRK